jgi:hypothetical protein
MAEITKFADAIAWPVAALLGLWLLIRSVGTIADAFRRAPIIRRIKLRNFEIELARENLDDLKRDTDKTFVELVRKTDLELQRFSRTVNLPSYLSQFSTALWAIMPDEKKAEFHKASPRMTLYAVDPVFEDQLYQICSYCVPNTGRFSLTNDKGPGRRFSMRYGIIGLAARTEKSQIEGDAFVGSEEKREALIKTWSMMPEQANSAASKPSCVAIAVHDPSAKSLIGVVYADAELQDFFCEDGEKLDFLGKAMSLAEFTKLADALADFSKLARQIELKFDLVHIGNSKQ